MRRAIPLLLFGVCVLAILPPGPDARPRAISMIDAVGLVDYTRKPEFGVGDWVQYHVTGSSQMGLSDDYVVTVLIGGEERFWGDDGFWIETWTDSKGNQPRYVASLMSYAIFNDPEPHQHLEEYGRKLVTSVDDEGRPIQEIRVQSQVALRGRRRPDNATIEWHTDSLGADTVMVPKGNFRCLKIRLRHGVRATVEAGDSTFENQVEEHRTLYKSLDVPITSIVREDIEKWIRRRAWRAGQSQDAPMVLREHTMGSARLMDYGSGLKPRMVPEAAQRPLPKDPPRSSKPPARRGATPRKTG